MNGVASAGNTAANGVVTAGTTVADGAQNAAGTVAQVGENTVNKVQDFGGNVVEHIQSTGGTVINNVKVVGETFVNNVKVVGEKVLEEVKNAVVFESSTHGVIPFDINYDSATGGAKNKRMTWLDIDRGKLDCVNCYTNGSTVIELHIKATLGFVTVYTLTINGELHANMDFDLTIKHNNNADKFVFRKNVFSVPLSPFTIPGIFK